MTGPRFSFVLAIAGAFMLGVIAKAGEFGLIDWVGAFLILANAAIAFCAIPSSEGEELRP
jgi:hypothetical protein